MKVALYTKFQDAAQAEKALAALVDRGAEITDLTAMFPEGYQVRDKESAVASLLIPGFGLVSGGSALVSALICVAGATAGGAFAGGVTNLEDQGVPYRVAVDSEVALKNGSAVIAIDCPTGSLGELDVMEFLRTYHAESIGRAGEIVEPFVVIG